MRDLTFTDVSPLAASDEVREMDEDAFRAFYDETSRPLWAYLARATGDRELAGDLLQETYYRFVRSAAAYDGDAHRRHYLFRIAMNLVRDRRRRPRPDSVPLGEHAASVADERADPRRLDRCADVARALAGLKPRDRDLLWSAYALGASHEQLAAMFGLRAASLKQLLFRARRRFAAMLGIETAGRRRR